MAGPEGSSTAEGRVQAAREALERELDEQLRRLGLPPVLEGYGSEAAPLLDVTREQMRAMSPLEVAEGGVLLRAMAYHLQRRHARLEAVISWLDRNIESVIAPTVGGLPGWSLEERRPLAIRQNETARALAVVRSRLESMSKDLQWQSSRVEGLAASFESMSRIMAKQQGETR